MLEKIVKVRGKTKFEKKIIRTAIFVWNLVLYSVPLNLFEFKIIPVPQFVLDTLSSLETALLNSVGIAANLTGNTIYACGASFTIAPECSGYKSLLGLFAIVMATPTKDLRNRVKWFLYLSPITIALNFLRIFSTVLLHCSLNIDIEFVHNVLWQILTTLAVFFLWLFFLIKNRQNLIEF